MKYSVIIPVYNAEKTLRRCVDSLLEQDFHDAEIILVNDGSQDGSASICKEYADRYDCVRFISQPNGGVSSARNAGLDNAQGNYILFVDSDDYVLPEFFQYIDRTVRAHGFDFIQFSGVFDNGHDKAVSIRKPVYADSREKLIPHIIDAMCNKSINSPWANLYRREIIEAHKIRFPLGASVGEDRVFNIVYSFFINNYLVSEKEVYVINIENESSLSRKRHADLKEQFEITQDYFGQELEAASIPEGEKDLYRRAYDFGICRGVYHDAKLMIQDNVGWLSRQKQLLQLCSKINGRHMKYPNTKYCKLISLPVRMYLTPIIDMVVNHSNKKK